MNKSELTESEYQYQYFKFDSDLFTESVRALLKDSFKKEFENTEKLNPELSEPFSELIAKYMQSADDAINRVKPAIKQFFSIPQNILLDEDEAYSLETDEEVEDLHTKINELKEEYEKQRIFQKVLEQKVQELEAFKPLIDSLNIMLPKIKCNDKANAEKIVKKYEKFLQLNEVEDCTDPVLDAEDF